MGRHQVALIAVAILGVAACQGPGAGEFRLNANTGIEGSGLPGDPLRLADAGFVTGLGTAGALPKFSSATTVSPSIISEADGGIGIGREASSYAGLSVARGIRGEPYFVDNTAYMGQPAADSIGFYTSGGIERMRITAAGNVGIGTTSPAELLVISKAWPGTTRLSIDNRLEDPASEARIDLNVGVPGRPCGLTLTHTSPKSKDTFAGGLSNADFSGVVQNCQGTDNGNGLVLGTANSQRPTPVLFLTAGAERARITGDGKLGIGTANPQRALDVNGDIHGVNIDANGSITAKMGMCCGSSRGLKRDIHDLDAGDALAALGQLHPTHFAYNANPTEPKLGFIAEDVPDLVAMNDRKALDPMEFAALLTKVVQEQQKEIAAQKQQNAELLRRLERVEAALGRRGK